MVFFLTWIRIRIQSMRIHITGLYVLFLLFKMFCKVVAQMSGIPTTGIPTTRLRTIPTMSPNSHSTVTTITDTHRNNDIPKYLYIYNKILHPKESLSLYFSIFIYILLSSLSESFFYFCLAASEFNLSLR